MSFIDRHSQTIFRILRFLLSPVFRFYFWYKHNFLVNSFHLKFSFKNGRFKLDWMNHQEYVKQTYIKLKELKQETDHFPLYLYKAIKTAKNCGCLIFKDPERICRVEVEYMRFKRIEVGITIFDRKKHLPESFGALGALSFHGYQRRPDKTNILQLFNKHYSVDKYKDTMYIKIKFGRNYATAAWVLHDLFKHVLKTDQAELKCTLGALVSPMPAILKKLDALVQSFERRG